jgi:hypothetical protein
MNNKDLVYLFIFLAVIYLGLVVVLPADPSTLEKYNMTQDQARWLNLTVILPALAIWVSALYGYIHFRSYAQLVKNSPEGAPFKKLADGLGILAFSLPATAILSSALTYMAVQDADLQPVSTIVRNYARLGFSLAAFLVIATGAKNLLMTLSSKRAQIVPVSNFLVLGVILLSSIFTWLILSRPTGAGGAINAYHEPTWLIILTLAVPYLYAWYQGALAFYRLHAYKIEVKGQIYKEAFGNLAAGIGIVVLLSIIIQFITTLSAQLNRLNFTPVLLIIYLLVLLYAVGFGLIARGSKKFKKIEEV